MFRFLRGPCLLSAFFVFSVSNAFADGITDSILDAFSAGFFSTLGSACLAAFQWLLDGFILAVGYCIHIIFLGMLSCASGALSTIGLASMLASFVENLVGLPDGMVWLLNQVGFFPGLTVILSAIVLRKGLDIIPLPWQL